MLKIFPTLILSLFLLASCDNEAQSIHPHFAHLPPDIARLGSEVLGLSTKDSYERLEKALGRPTRESGSGIRYRRWDLPSGVVTHSTSLGAHFKDHSGHITRFVITQNRVKENLFRCFGMTSRANLDPRSNGNRYHLGTLKLDENGTYLFKPGRGMPDTGQHYFVAHPNGEFTITYSPEFCGSTILEELPPQPTLIARIHFKSPDSTLTLDLYSDEQDRRMSFDTESHGITLERSWKNLR